MRKTIAILCPLFLISLSLFAGGCAAVRTYSEEKARVDQVLTAGNQGYLLGTPKEGEVPQKRKMTRKTYVTEIEVGFPHRKKKAPSPAAVVKEAAVEPAGEPMPQEAVPTEVSSAAVAGQPIVSYTVLPNDTLQKISQKVYGTSKKWKLIFEANTHQLKSPDRVYAGQVLNIPQE